MEWTGNIQLPPSVQSWLKKHINIERVLWLMATILFLIAWNRGLALLYGLFAFIVSALLLSYWGVYRQLRGLRVALDDCDPKHCDDVIDIPFQVHCRGRRQFLLLALHEMPYVQSEVAAATTFSMAFSGTLKASVHKRGRHSIRQVVVSSMYPFGLIKRYRVVSVKPIEILVYPRIQPTNGVADVFKKQGEETGNLHQHNNQGHHSVATLREYQYGDEMRHIHWRKSAQLHEWVVKEFDATHNPCMNVYLNAQPSWQMQNMFDPREHMIEVVAALTCLAKSKGFELKLHFSHAHVVTVEPWQVDLQPVLYQLAVWNPEPHQRAYDGILDGKGTHVFFIDSGEDCHSIITALPLSNLVIFRIKADTYPSLGLNKPVSREKNNDALVIDMESSCRIKDLIA